MAKLRKIKGSTMIEVLVAMVILLIMLGIGMSIFLNNAEHNNPLQKVYAGQIADSLLEYSEQNREYIDKAIEVEGISLILEFRNYHGNNNSLLAKVSVYDNRGKSLFDLKEIIIVDQ